MTVKIAQLAYIAVHSAHGPQGTTVVIGDDRVQFLLFDVVFDVPDPGLGRRVINLQHGLFSLLGRDPPKLGNASCFESIVTVSSFRSTP